MNLKRITPWVLLQHFLVHNANPPAALLDEAMASSRDCGCKFNLDIFIMSARKGNDGWSVKKLQINRVIIVRYCIDIKYSCLKIFY